MLTSTKRKPRARIIQQFWNLAQLANHGNFGRAFSPDARLGNRQPFG